MGHAVLIADFASDINAYLQQNPGLGIKDLNALIDQDAAHPEVKSSLRASAGMVGSAQAGLYEQELAQRKVVARTLSDLLKTHDLDALAYPTIRRIAAKLGEEQLGTNCRLAANSWLSSHFDTGRFYR